MQICEMQGVLGDDFQRTWVESIKAPYAVYQVDQWMSYDDLESIKFKVILPSPSPLGPE